MKYCSNCGHSPLEKRQLDGDHHVRIICPNCGTVHYQNPKIVTGCLVLHGDQVLLCKRDIEPRKGKWNLTAGFMENNETLKEGAIREVWEEAYAKVKIRKLHCVYNIMHVNQVYMLFLADLVDENFSAGEETSDVQLVDLDKIPWDDLAFESNVFALQKYLEDPTFEGVHHGDNSDFMHSINPDRKKK